MKRKIHSSPPPTADGEAQHRILESARAEFARHGLAGGRVERIADAAGVNKAMIYYHFDSKEKLYLEAVVAVLQEAAGTVTGMVELIGESCPLEEILERMADFYETLFHNHPDYRAILLRELATPDSPVIKELGERFAVSGLPDALLRRLQEASDAEEIRDVDLRQTLLSFILMHVGYYLMSPIVNRILSVDDAAAFIEQRKKATVDLFLNGVRRQS